ncbi:major facilitator superfamily tranporter [Erwinia amylovora MR1]|nr:major facilitator superfamily tranporter [Erwinia amylovora MR1]
MPDSLMSSPLSPALNPAFDEQMIEETMPSLDIEPETEQEVEVTTLQGANPDEETGLKKAWEKL